MSIRVKFIKEVRWLEQPQEWKATLTLLLPADVRDKYSITPELQNENVEILEEKLGSGWGYTSKDEGYKENKLSMWFKSYEEAMNWMDKEIDKIKHVLEKVYTINYWRRLQGKKIYGEFEIAHKDIDDFLKLEKEGT